MIFTDLRHLRILLSKGRRWMITLGMDPHPGSHTVAALDSNGSLLGSIKVLNTSAGLEQLHQFASQFPSRRWAIEGAGNRFLAQFVNELLAKGETIYAIAASLTSRYRCLRGTKKRIRWTRPTWLRLYQPIRSFHLYSIQTDRAICKSCRGLSEDLEDKKRRRSEVGFGDPAQLSATASTAY